MRSRRRRRLVPGARKGVCIKRVPGLVLGEGGDPPPYTNHSPTLWWYTIYCLMQDLYHQQYHSPHPIRLHVGL